MNNNIFNEMDTAVESLTAMRNTNSPILPSVAESALSELERAFSNDVYVEKVYHFRVEGETLEVPTDGDGDIQGGLEEFSREFQDFIQDVINNQ